MKIPKNAIGVITDGHFIPVSFELIMSVIEGHYSVEENLEKLEGDTLQYVTQVLGANRVKYYYLKEGDLIIEGDEVDMSANYDDPENWVKGSPKTVGSMAPNPGFPAHRRYRRRVDNI